MKILFSISLLAVLNVFCFSQSYEIDALVFPKKMNTTITVGQQGSDIPGYTNNAIQYAIEALKESGGTVKLSAGTFIISSPVRCYSNIQLVGSGSETILKRDKGIESSFVVDADYGELKIEVENSDGFHPGMKIQVTDNNNASCWDVSTAFITEIINNTLFIDDYLIRDYHSDENGRVSNASSVIEIIESKNVIISSLVVNGNKKENFRADGCNGAGIYVFKSTDVTIDNVHVMDFNGEGISWQITERVTVKNSEISGSGNIGLHPGTGSPISLIENNNVHDNEVDGLFICWRVHHSIVKNNTFHHNGRYGICTGHKDSDVVFDSNHIYDNGSDGVNLRGENEKNAPHSNTFINNIIENNGRKNGGYGFSINSPARNLVLEKNIIRDTDKKTQTPGIYIHKNGLEPELINNQIEAEKGSVLVFESRE